MKDAIAGTVPNPQKAFWTLQELAEYYEADYDTMRREFLKEPDVLKIRRTYRVPDDVRIRVERRWKLGY